jgi:hypothetical protein
MRRAFIGFSSPTAYYYDHDQRYFKEDWRWNPILESPQGLIALFDELWFITRALCPVSMRNESYVKFIDEDSSYSEWIFKILEMYRTTKGDEFIDLCFPYLRDFLDLSYDKYRAQISRFHKIVGQVYGVEPDVNNPIDNHSHRIMMGTYHLNGDCLNTNLVALDNVLFDFLSIPGSELITNRFNDVFYKKEYSNLNKVIATQGITIKRIPVIQAPNGPILKDIERIRENNYLIDFRQKIVSSDYIDSEGLINEIESEFGKYRANLLDKKLKGCTIGSSISKNLISLVYSKAIPLFIQAKSIIEDSETRKLRWTGFINELEL